ncbi:TlpA family protein disulfide reductase [Streptomyces sp. NPDC127074]|uniref:TlpA family protein disulfide reductase n=1 Tax=Streptomyces sp. NPDC127074 TaxID=3347130 RepID=UPI00364C09CF
MAYLTAGVIFVGLLCLLDLVLTFGVIRRLREQEPAEATGGLRDAPSVLAPGSTVAAFSALDMMGGKLTRESLAEGLAITFLSPGCPACEEVLPLVVERARQYGADQVLAVVVREEGDDADPAEFMERLSPVARVVVTDQGDELTEAFALTGMPAYVAMGPEGRIADSGRTLPRRAGSVRAGV